MKTMRKLKYILRFWRDTTLVFGTVVSAALVFAYFMAASSGEAGSMLSVIFIGRGIVSALIVYMLSQSRRICELDYYNNLGVGAGVMLRGIAVADYALFAVMIKAVSLFV